jgi:hypothetical protein
MNISLDVGSTARLAKFLVSCRAGTMNFAHWLYHQAEFQSKNRRKINMFGKWWAL